MDFSNIDKSITQRLKYLIDSYGIKGIAIADWLNIRPSSASDMITGRSPWKINHLIKLAIYFGLTLEELIFDDPNFIKKHNQLLKKKRKEEVLKIAKEQDAPIEFIEKIKEIL